MSFLMKLHFIAHSHWDREWYMPFEKHRFRLVALMDRLIDTLLENKDFRSYHLDGQIVLLEDYLEIRPERREIVQKLLDEGRIKAGPMYILQDEFLISGESNVRNLTYGFKEGLKYTNNLSRCGYFPDAFGNISQMPQILAGFGLSGVYFGRGISPISFNNSMMNTTTDYKSELIWQSPDGTQITAVQFSNWYNNACDLPVETDDAVKFIKRAADACASVATTENLLLMNGSDHLPVNMKLPDILKRAEPFIEDEMLISSLDDYMDAVKQDNPKLEILEGELISQKSDGWSTLVNTASSRLDLKKKAWEVQRKIFTLAEPMSLISGDYDRDYLDYAIKLMLKNFPHDSICCCSDDLVHKEMATRFDKAVQVAESIINKASGYTFKPVFTVYNTDVRPKSGYVSLTVRLDEYADPRMLTAKNSAGESMVCDIEYTGKKFTYELPDEGFRKTKYRHEYQVELYAEQIPAVGYEAFTIEKGERKSCPEPKFTMDFNPDGSFNITDKDSGKRFLNQNVLEYTGDAGDEYMFRQSGLPQSEPAQVEIHKTACVFGETWTVKRVYMNPERTRVQFKAVSRIILRAHMPYIIVENEIDNHAEDYRIRALFDTGVLSGTVYADGQLDITARPIKQHDGWTNPSNCQRQQAFVGLKQDDDGLLVANRGLPEYEAFEDGRIAVTLLRCVGQLGDWGVFPAPDSQMPGLFKTEIAIVPFENFLNGAQAGYDFANEYLYAVQAEHTGQKSLFEISGSGLVVSAIKKAEAAERVVVRIYNPHTEAVTASVNGVKTISLADMKEMEIKPLDTQFEVPPKKIMTLLLELDER